jgi:hypothetical protein
MARKAPRAKALKPYRNSNWDNTRARATSPPASIEQRPDQFAPAPTSRAKLGTKQEVFMSKQLRLTIYKEGSTNYRYLVHGANPSLRGRFRIPIPLTGNSELVAIKDALRAGSHRLEPFIANLKVVPRYSAAQKARSASPVW